MSSLLVFPAIAALSFVTTAIWLWMARRRQWFDHPNSRSSHQLPTPKSGGAGFVLGFIVSVIALLLLGTLSEDRALLFVGAPVIALLGLVDDMRGLGIRSRLSVQIVAVLSLLPFLQNLPPLDFSETLSIDGWWLVILASIAMVWLINLYNFMDGIDALAATEAIFFCLALSVFAGIKGEGMLVTTVLCLAAAISSFLFFNLPVAKVFMGDLGSNFLGFTLGVFGLWAVQVDALNYWAVLLLLGTFIADSTTTLLGRLVGGAVWYHPHKTHGYQKAAMRLRSHGKVVVLNATINLLWLTPMAMLVQRTPEWGSLLAVAGLLPLAGLVLYLRRDKERTT